MRVRNWEAALRAEVERHKVLPFSWSESNCFYFAMDCVRAVSGADPWEDARGCDSEDWYKRWLVRHGFKTVGDAFAARFSEILTSMMGRGDIGVVEQDDCTPGVVCVGSNVLGKMPVGLVSLPRSRVVRAFRVQ